MGLVPPRCGFLELLREQADASGALLVFDEVITGFRVSPGRRPGADAACMPDLTVMGKVVGGGLPAAAYGGSVELMERIAPAGDVYQAGTLSGNPLAVAAGAARARAARRRGLRAPGRDDRRAGRRPARGGRRPAGAGGRHHRPADRLLLREPVHDYAGAAACDLDAHAAWCRALLARGVYPPPSQFEAWFPSLAHTPRARRRARSRPPRRRSRSSAERRRCTRPRCAARRELRADGGLLADTVVEPDGDAPHGATAAAGPARRRARRGLRAAGRGDPRGLPAALRRPGACVQPDEPDLALLAGDRLYALGLERLAELGDLEAVAVLADVISLAAQAHAEDEPPTRGSGLGRRRRGVGHGGSRRARGREGVGARRRLRATGALDSAARRAR